MNDDAIKKLEREIASLKQLIVSKASPIAAYAK